MRGPERNYGGNWARSEPLRSLALRRPQGSDKWISPQLKSLDLLRSKGHEANLSRLIKLGTP